MPKIVIVGGILIALRLVFPVLECTDYYKCTKGHISFFPLGPVDGYRIHTQRTNSQAVAIGVLLATAWLALRKRKDV